MKIPMKYQHSAACLLGIALVQFWLGAMAYGSSFQLVSKPDVELGPPAGGSGDSYLPVVSPDARYVLFGSTADNLLAYATNRSVPPRLPAPINVFLRDRAKGSTVLVSVNSEAMGGGNGDSLPIGISTNGRYALFESRASNLVPGDTNNASDVFLRDLEAGTTLLVSVSTNGTCADNASFSSVMTPDGRFVAFASSADNLTPGDTDGIPDVFIREMVSNITTMVSVGAQPNDCYSLDQRSDTPIISPDGRFIAFYSTATNLAPGVATSGNVYLRDQSMGTTICASAGALAALQSLATVPDSVSFNHAMSDDGRFVFFEAVPYLESLKPPFGLILRYDTQTSKTELIETNAAVPVNSSSRTISYENVQNLSITPDGRLIGYVANAVDNSGMTTAIRVWDAQSGLSTLVSGNTNGSVTPGSLSDLPVLDATGRFIAFVSGAPDLVTNQTPTDFHLYLRDLQTLTTTLIDSDTNSAGSLIDPTTAPAMSRDARLIAFHQQEGSVGPWNAKHSYDVLSRDPGSPAAELISVRDPNQPSLTPNGSSVLSSSSVNSSARFIAFWSEADDLVANDTNGLRDVFVRDLLGGTNVLVSVNTNGVSGDGYSTDSAISADGRYVAFTSSADDLVSGDTNGATDVFVRDLQTGATTLVSVNAFGTGPGNAASYSPVVSSNGQFVLFHSQANDLYAVTGSPNGMDNLFWRDLAGNQTYQLTTNQSGFAVTAASMTPDGSLVALATGNISPYVAPLSHIYLWESASASIVYSLSGSLSTAFGPMALSPNGLKLVYNSNFEGPLVPTTQLMAVDRVSNTNWVIASYKGYSSSSPRFSADSRFLAYVASPGATIFYTNQVFLYDFLTGTILLVSHGYDGVSLGNNHSDSPAISSDGRFVSYRSDASNLVPGDTNQVPDIFLYDQLTGATTLITGNRFGGADNRSLSPLFSGDGRTLVFQSWAGDLTLNDFNRELDVFALSFYKADEVSPFPVTVLPAGGATPSSWLSWPIISGKSYRVQFKQSLDDAIWQDLRGQISLLGDRGYFQDAVPTSAQRFYRVVAF